MKKYFMMHLKKGLEYKVSFILVLISQAISLGCAIFVVFSLFSKFGILKDFTLNECLLSLSIVDMGYYFAEFIFRGFDSFAKQIIKGRFDLLLIRPENIYIQILGSEMEPTKISRLVVSVGMLVYSITANNLSLNLSNVLVLSIAVIGSLITFASLMIIGAGITFYTIEGLELVNIFTCGSREMGEYPMGIYHKNIRKVFTYGIPVACVNYFPVLFLLGRDSNIIYALSPLYTIVIFVFSIIFFNISLKHYQSSGS